MRQKGQVWRWCPRCAVYWPARRERQWCLHCHELLIDRTPIDAPPVLPFGRVRQALRMRGELLAVAGRMYRRLRSRSAHYA